MKKLTERRTKKAVKLVNQLIRQQNILKKRKDKKMRARVKDFKDVYRVNEKDVVLVFSDKKKTAETVSVNVCKNIGFLSDTDYKQLASGIFSFVSDGEIVKRSEKNGQRKRSKKDIRFFIDGPVVNGKSSNSEKIPEFLGYWMVQEAYRYVIRALKTVYVSSYHPYIYQLWGNAIADSMNYNRQFHNNEIETELKEQKRYRDSLTGKMFQLEHAEKTQKIVYDAGKLLDFSDTLAEMDGFTETKVSKEVNTDTTVDALLSNVYERICTLYTAGQITSLNDVILQKGCIYSAVNEELYRERTEIANIDTMRKCCVIVHDDGTEEIIISHYKMDDFSNFIEDVKKVIENAVKPILSKTIDLDDAITAYILYHAYGFKQKVLAEKFECKQQQVSRWLKYIDKACCDTRAQRQLADLL